MTIKGSTRAQFVLGPAHGEEAPIPLRPDGKPIRVFRMLRESGEVMLYLRRHQAVGRDWIYIYEPDAK
jgi:hypothetical protein